MHTDWPSSITRRDFLGGVALVVGSGLTPLAQLRAEGVGIYPPAMTGLRGSHEGSFEAAHALRDGMKIDASALPVKETYDLIVVGGGISGLAAALFWRQKHGDQARILILDNHDDFGGHAKRNEFTTPDGQLLIGYGGSEALEAPQANFSEAVWGLLDRLGVDLTRFDTAFNQGLYEGLGLTAGTFLNAAGFGTDRMVQVNMDEPEAFLAAANLSAEATSQLTALLSGEVDPLAGRSADEKREYLSGVSYRDYLAKDCGLGEEALRLFEGITHDYFAIGFDAIPADWVMDSGYPGFAGLGLDQEGGEEEPYIYHFPDGNAGIARLMVRALVPDAVPGSTMEDVVLARADYARLDQPESACRIRLNATALHVANVEAGVEVIYHQNGTLHKVAGGATVLAFYNMVIPHIAPELPQAQKEALARNVKAPLVYVNVALRDWQAVARAGVSSASCPTSFFPMVMLDFPVALGGYLNASDPAQPIVLRMVHVPTAPGLPQNDQFRAGRAALMEMAFEDYEAEITQQLTAMFGPYGLDAARDIFAITVNRWPHGYAGFLNPLFDPPEDEALMEIARQPSGRIAIANSDAGWNAFAHEAIDQAFRAVTELTT